ncbi:hypothetical protein AEQU2_00068 [Aequorivita lipolytica]|nr:hypothetical protein AEQU2_00068 [Aequorivita lipolytica]
MVSICGINAISMLFIDMLAFIKKTEKLNELYR